MSSESLGRALAPSPDFRYVGLEPARPHRAGVKAMAFGVGAGLTAMLGGCEGHHAVVAGMIAAGASAWSARRARLPQGAARMAIVPWGVLVDSDVPRILRWAAIRRIDVVTWPVDGLFADGGPASRVAVLTERELFLGRASGVVCLDRLVQHLDAYAREQSVPLALDFEGDRSAEQIAPACERLLASVRAYLETAEAAKRLGLSPAGYRRTAARAATTRTTEVLRRVLGDQTPKRVDPRAFAAIVAAEVRADVVPELLPLTQCPHPIVAAVAKQAARKLGVPRARTGTLEEIGAFLWEPDRVALDAW